ncbi:MAG: hypothetical protein ACI97A_001034 [Planctomycetota bacterium]
MFRAVAANRQTAVEFDQIDNGDGALGLFGLPNGLFFIGNGASVGTAAGTLLTHSSLLD